MGGTLSRVVSFVGRLFGIKPKKHVQIDMSVLVAMEQKRLALEQSGIEIEKQRQALEQLRIATQNQKQVAEQALEQSRIEMEEALLLK